MKIIIVSVLMLAMTACSAISEKVLEVAGNDLKRTSELAERYGKPDVKICADFLLASIGNEDATLAKLDALLKEDTAGLASAALKAALVADLVRGLNDPAKQAKFETDFKTNCEKVAGAIMINVLRDARKVGSKVGTKGF